jgi:hypothetical protein
MSASMVPALALMSAPHRTTSLCASSLMPSFPGIGQIKIAQCLYGRRERSCLIRLKAVDFKKVTHIGLEYGTNDFTVCAPLPAFKESLSYSVRKMLAAFPVASIFDNASLVLEF